MASVIIGAGDIGRRIASCLNSLGEPYLKISAYVRTTDSVAACSDLGIKVAQLDLDGVLPDMSQCHDKDIYYTVAPQKIGVTDQRSKALQTHFVNQGIVPRKLILISTTGVYGDCNGEWVTEKSPANPQTERGKRRLDSENRWLQWGQKTGASVVVLRVPGIYAYNRLPRERLRKRTPVVRAVECGYTNRIHADDLANVCVVAMRLGLAYEIYNVTDGVPGKITEYLQAAAEILNLEPLPEISMQQAQLELSAGMLSYLGESRKISNRKMLDDLGVCLKYTDFKLGIKN